MIPNKFSIVFHINLKRINFSCIFFPLRVEGENFHSIIGLLYSLKKLIAIIEFFFRGMTLCSLWASTIRKDEMVEMPILQSFCWNGNSENSDNQSDYLLEKLIMIEIFLTFPVNFSNKKNETVSIRKDKTIGMTIQLETVKSKLTDKKKSWTVSETPRNVSRENCNLLLP